MARNRSGGQMGLFGQEKLCILGRREDLCKMSAADTYNAAARSERASPFPSFPTFQCQKLRLVLAHADLRGEFVHAALRPRRRRSVVSRKKFRHDMNNHTVSQSRSSSSSFELCQIWRRSPFPGRVWRGPGEIFWAPPRAFVLSLSGNFLANLNVDFILRRL